MGNPFNFSNEAAATDLELLQAMKRLAVLSESDLARLLPVQADQEQLRTLISSVNAAANDNNRAANLRSQLVKVGSNVANLVKSMV